ncbi:hypothetical protein [Alienimonas chondri]|uniref:ATP-grasp domain-containing protein n=1 Tax=Alienimonas chondri TaxID=2681879 RepID=A0ABX1VNN8_9PLAN|nr:hypothetical protein [Alienimonas chondri]NNJ27991.1 hypothetical protein [Alienimonas chondri]
MSFSTGTDRSEPDRGPTLYVANFDFDDRLAKPAMTSLPMNLRTINARLAPMLQGLCGPDDAVALPGDWVKDAGRFERVEPWGVEPHVLAWLRTAGAGEASLSLLPDPAIVRIVNSRQWQWETEQALDLTSGEVSFCDSSEAVWNAVDSFADRTRGWVLKADHGGSGRGLRFGAGSPPEAVVRWADGCVGRGLGMTVEPRDDRAREYSAHLSVTDRGVTFEGICFLHSTPTGRFRSVEPLKHLSPALTEAVPVWTAVGEKAWSQGYRGPLGIDAAAAFGVVERPVRDVNARWTMGRLALTLGRKVSNP